MYMFLPVSSFNLLLLLCWFGCCCHGPEQPEEPSDRIVIIGRFYAETITNTMAGRRGRLLGRMAATVLLRRPRMLVSSRCPYQILRRQHSGTTKWSLSQFAFMSTESFQKKRTTSNQNDKQSKQPEESWASIEWIQTLLFGIIFGVVPVSLMINNVFGGLGTTQGQSVCPICHKSSVHAVHFVLDVRTRDLHAAHFESSWILKSRSGLSTPISIQKLMFDSPWLSLLLLP